MFIAIDAAVSDWYKNGAYTLPKRKITVSRDELIDYFSALKEKYPYYIIRRPAFRNRL